MLQFLFSVEDAAADPQPLDPLTWGAITISARSEDDGVTQVNTRQPVLLIPSVAELLAGLQALRENPRLKKWVFEASGAPFQVAFEKRKQDRVALSSRQVRVGVFPAAHVEAALLRGVHHLCGENLERLACLVETNALGQDLLQQFFQSYGRFTQGGELPRVKQCG